MPPMQQPMPQDPRQRQLPQRNAQLMAMMRMLMAGNQPQVTDDSQQHGFNQLRRMLAEQAKRTEYTRGPVMSPYTGSAHGNPQGNLLEGDVWRGTPGRPSTLTERWGKMNPYWTQPA